MASFFKDGAPRPRPIASIAPTQTRSLTGQQVVDEALHYAVYSGGREAIDFLLERGANIDALVGFFLGVGLGQHCPAQGRGYRRCGIDSLLAGKRTQTRLLATPAVGETAYDWAGLLRQRRYAQDHRRTRCGGQGDRKTVEEEA